MQIIYKYIVCILLFTCLGFTQDTLITKQGKQYIGKVIDSDSKSVKFSFSGWDTPKRFYLNSAEVLLGPKIPKIPKIPKKSIKELENEKKYLFFSIEERAIYDAKLKARRWVLFPTFASATFGTLNEFTNLMVGAVGIGLSYFILKEWDTFLIVDTPLPLFYNTYNDFEKQLYHNTYKRTLNKRKILYSTVGIIAVPIILLFIYPPSLSEDSGEGFFP